MNTKKNKNKSKSNKTQNPNQPQKSEEINKNVEVVEDVSIGEIDSAPKSDIRVPEIISEVITPVVDEKEKEDDFPKKPKRNRGKKKKQDKDVDETQEEKPIESVDIIEIVEVETQEIIIEENLSAPSARKKKNKNAKAVNPEVKVTEKIEKEVPVIEQKKPDDELIVKEETKSEDAAQETKSSKKKNKKKKRNDSERSEKADELSCTAAFQKLMKDDKTEVKTVENPPTEEVKAPIEVVPDDPKIEERDVSKDKSMVTDLVASTVELTKAEVAQDTPKNEPGGKNKKNKKKDKKEHPKEKEIKYLPESDIEFDLPEIVPITSIIPPEVAQNVQVAATETLEKATGDFIIEIKSPVEDVKPKAKIAKPVERKKKGKDDSQVQESAELELSAALLKEPPAPAPQVEEKPITVEAITTDIPDSPLPIISMPGSIQEASKAEVTTPGPNFTEFMDVPGKDKNIKRKKSPKPKEQKATPMETKTETVPEDVKPAVIAMEIKGEPVSKEETTPLMETKAETVKKPESKPAIITTEVTETNYVEEAKSKDAAITEAFEDLIRIPESDKNKKRKKSPKPKADQKAKTLPEPTVEPVTEPIKITPTEIKPPHKEEMTPLLATEILEFPETEIREEPKSHVEEEIKKELLPVEKDEAKFTETKSKMKRKKSPKLLLGPEPTSVVKSGMASEMTTEKQETKPPKDRLSGDTTKGMTDIFYTTPSEDIEIRSLKTDESEGSACGFTPDIIQYPRATSQDLIDDNNNMLIQEMTVEEVKMQIPLDIPDTPFIQGSGETPMDTPECVFVGIQSSMVNIEARKSEQEKTDIKSKMMEVNQDMEELRLSIERSLAELTAIEKSEGEIEKKFEEKKTFTPVAPQSPEVKISMPSELIFKSQTEKTETPEQQDTKIADVITPVKVDDKPANLSSLEKKSNSKNIQSQPLEVIVPPAPPKPNVDTSKPEQKKVETITPPVVPVRKDKSVSKERDIKYIPMKPSDDIKPVKTVTETAQQETPVDTSTPPVIPARKENKNKGKNKKRGKQDTAQPATQAESASGTTETKQPVQETTKKDNKPEQKSDTKQEKGKQQSTNIQTDDKPTKQDGDQSSLPDFEPIENFEDAMTSSADDINKTFEMIANEATQTQFQASHVNPEIKIVAPIEDTKPDAKDEKVNPVSPPKNLLGHPDIPVPSNRTDYKKEKNKAPNTIMAKVKIKDAIQIEGKKQTKDTQTDNIRKFMKNKSIDESFSSVTNDNDEFVYKYSFRKVFLQSACHVCKKELKQTRVPCNFCNLIFYCNAKHKDEDWAKHQGFCFAASTIVHLKDQKHIYADAQNITGQEYRLLRMQMIVSCEKVLKRKLTPFEQEALLYPRICASAACRECRQSRLVDCDGCGQISYCSDHPDHFPKAHQRWCKSYSLYQKLVCYQQTKGRLEPKLPSKILTETSQVSEKMNEVLAAMYEEKIDMNDIQYAALTQIATAPLTVVYCLQAYAKMANHTNGTYKKSTCTIHVVGGELQFEADALNKWEVFLLHLRPELVELRVVMVGRELNPSNLPLELLGKVKLCDSCRSNKRRVVFSFQDKTTYHDYWASDDYVTPDIVCTFNPSIKRSSMYNGKDPWPKTINCIIKQKTPFLITAHTMTELQKDLTRVRDCSEVDLKTIIEPKYNSFASVRPDRNFISDDEMPLLFKNYCYALVTGAN